MRIDLDPDRRLVTIAARPRPCGYDRGELVASAVADEQVVAAMAESDGLEPAGTPTCRGYRRHLEGVGRRLDAEVATRREPGERRRSASTAALGHATRGGRASRFGLRAPLPARQHTPGVRRERRAIASIDPPRRGGTTHRRREHGRRASRSRLRRRARPRPRRGRRPWPPPTPRSRGPDRRGDARTAARPGRRRCSCPHPSGRLGRCNARPLGRDPTGAATSHGRGQAPRHDTDRRRPRWCGSPVICALKHASSGRCTATVRTGVGSSP